jgi:hypothetical protein
MALVKYNNNSISAVTSASSIPSGALVPIKTLTASSSSTLSFVDGSNGVVFDNTYPIYKFKFINCHPATNEANFTFNMSTDSGSNYNVTKTSTFFASIHKEDGSSASVSYFSNVDLAQSTSFQQIAENIKNDNDIGVSGEMYLFNPSSTTFVKHFLGRTNHHRNSGQSSDEFVAGYGNITNPVDAVRFQMSSGNIDSGKIKLYGIKDS